MSSMHPWPEVRDEDHWVVEEMEACLQDTQQSPAELRARASELRAEGERTDIKGIREAVMALAERYEHAADVRAATR